jgi:two-component system OmpR family response regulator
MTHILVVEDEEHLAKGIRFNLEAEGYQVSTVADGNSALELLQRKQPPIDLVILDLMLPGMSGYAVCETLRESGGDMPVLILSARTLTEDRTRGFKVGADQYLTKPFELDELLSRVDVLLKRHLGRTESRQVNPQATRAFQFANVRVDFDTFEAHVNGQVVRLTPLEMKLLEYFIRHEGRVISRQELLQNVWGQPGYLHTRAPDQFIRRLRKLFEPVPSQPRYFLTLRDAGYRFVSKPGGESSRPDK